MPSGIRRRRAQKQGVTKKKKARRTEKRDHSKKVFGNQLIAENWDTKLTLTQNYKNLGLASKLQNPAGGAERAVQDTIIKKNTVQTARIVHDEDGNTRVVYNDEDSEIDSGPESDEPVDQTMKWAGGVSKKKAANELIRKLEQQAKNVGRDDRHQSEQEVEWLERLVAKHGDDYNAMQWDKKLNKFQQSAGDLRRRIRKMRG